MSRKVKFKNLPDSFERLMELVEHLRGPNGCPWDRKQNHVSLKQMLLEECYELIEAIDQDDSRKIAEEMGDMLGHIAFHCQIAQEAGEFEPKQVFRTINDKLERRHPHVFGDSESPPDWEAMKAAERTSEAVLQNEHGETGIEPFEGISVGLDPLSRAARVQERMAAFGFDWESVEGALAKVREEIVELQQVADTSLAFDIGDASATVEEEAGDLLFAAANTARLAGAHPANALLVSISKFENRCRRMIELAEMRGIDWETVGIKTLDQLWDEVKQEGL